MKDVQAGVVYLVAATVIAWLWLSGNGSRGLEALRSGVTGQPVAALRDYRFRGGVA